MSAPPEDRPDVLDRRIGAGLIDFLVLFLIFAVVAVLFGETSAGQGKAAVKVEGAPALLVLLAMLLYYGVSEATSGQTVGKRLMKIRVVGIDGERAGAVQIALRTILRLVDGIAFYLVALIAILATGKRRQRLGDMAARTTVTRV